MQISTQEILEKERHNFWLWTPILFALGCAFFILFKQNFIAEIVIFIALFFAAILLAFFNRSSVRYFCYLASAIFLFGSFYVFSYEKIFLNYTEISGKVYVDGVGKVSSIKKFHNQINHLDGLHLVIEKPVLHKAEFTKKKEIKKKEIKKKKAKKKIDKKKGDKKKGDKKKIKKKDGEKKKSKKKKDSPKKTRAAKNLINVENQQDLDRLFMSYNQGYQAIKWLDEDKLFPNPPPKIALNLVKEDEEISVNDEIKFKALLEPLEDKEFHNDFDYKLNAKSQKIGASGFVIGKIEIVEKSKISSINSYFIKLREDIGNRINQHLSGNFAAIAQALLIGNQKAIAQDFYEKIRISGLAHLLSISGFHLSLAGAIFFFSSRFLLSRSEYLALNFDIKKFSAIFALLATYFYLKIAGEPVPAQRAFLMILGIFLALILSEKLNPKRAISASMLVIILYNPYVVLNIGFQLSFAAVFILATVHQEFNIKISPKILRYFFEIILLSIVIQIISLPFILHNFDHVYWLGFISNILAIPLTSFFIMPLGFLALFLMPIGLEKYVLLAMNEGILLLEKLINFVNEIPYANIASPTMSGLGLIIATIGIALILFHKNHLRCYGIILFLLSFSELKITAKPDLIFEKNQKFFAIYDKENGLVFSEKLRDSRQRKSWMKRFGEDQFKVGDFCQKTKCQFTKNGKKILVLTARNKISEICKDEFDLVVNLTGKYQLPDCLKTQQKIDNFDFYKRGTQEIFLNK